MKQIIKRALTSLLVITLVLQNVPLISFAEVPEISKGEPDDMDSAAGGGSGGGGVNRGGDWGNNGTLDNTDKTIQRAGLRIRLVLLR